MRNHHPPGAARQAFDAAAVVFAARVAWSAGNTVVGEAAKMWDRHVVPMTCPRCDTKLRGAIRGLEHWNAAHAAEVEAEGIVNAEANRKAMSDLFGGIFGGGGN